jgi:phospholipid/cholesterol/gamma-HCH transport system ATP-binding protein
MQVVDGSLVAVVGPSGTGKSVLLKLITGLLEVDAGEISIDGYIVTGNRGAAGREFVAKKMGVLFQAAALFDSMTLFENVSFPLEQRQELAPKEIKERSLEYLWNVGLKGYENKLPGEISIGMRKRVGIARALITEPKYLFFDEPNTGLDPEVGQGIYELIIKLHKRFGFTGIVISHEIPEIFQVCSRVIMLYEGQVQVDGSISEFLDCDKPVVRQFIQGTADGPIQLNF